MRTRPATVADIPAMLELERQAATAAHWSREQYDQLFNAQELRRVALLIETEDGEPRGFLVARSLDGEWEIENVVVTEAFQRRGLGTQLLDELLEQARAARARSVFLEVRESNRAARTLYAKRGFAVRGCRRNYYQNPPEDGLVYRLDLT